MRLTEYEQKMIKKTFLEVFGNGEIYLFGSRVDDTLRGGDIDLYLIIEEQENNTHRNKTSFLVKLDETIGEQKIDVIIAEDKNSLIEQEALRTGIKL